MTDRDRLIELLSGKSIDTEADVEYVADYLLANSVIVQKQGYWKDNCNGTFTCSVCGGKSSRMKYCGNCGAKTNLKEWWYE